MTGSCLIKNVEKTASAVKYNDVNLAIKVDVDTYRGTREGVPLLMHMLNIRGIKASFYLSLGPDNSGRAIWRIFRPGFINKMMRTRAPGTYGIKTMMYGTLLPAPLIGEGQSWLVQQLIHNGHEVGLHAWDHVTWHDRLWKMPMIRVRTEIKRGVEAFNAVAGSRPLSFAAPAWRISGPAVEALQKEKMVYMSATRGLYPYKPCIYGHTYDLLEIPTTLPTADEILGVDGVDVDNAADFFLEKILKPGLHVWTIHAEMEGMGLSGQFEKILDVCLENGVTFHRLIDVAENVKASGNQIPEAEIIKKEIPGRAGRVSHQKI